MNKEINSQINHLGTIDFQKLILNFWLASLKFIVNNTRSIVSQINKIFYRRAGKRIFDLLGGIVLMVFLFPFLFIFWIAVKLNSRGPAIFSQYRIGLKGKPFVFYKFRSMYIDQERRVDMKKIKAGESYGLLYKPKNDPRVTPVGRFFRMTSIDELPQLWNVIKGDMSFIGPRPLVPHMLAPYPEIMTHRCHVRPGLTGLWQVCARYDNTSVLGMVKYDNHYVDNYSLLMDIGIFLRTPLVVIMAKGAK